MRAVLVAFLLFWTGQCTLLVGREVKALAVPPLSLPNLPLPAVEIRKLDIKPMAFAPSTPPPKVPMFFKLCGGIILPPDPVHEGIDDVAFIKTLGETMRTATALQITFGENRRDVYYSVESVDIRTTFKLLAELLDDGIDDDYEFAFLEHDSPEDFIRSLHFKAQYSIVFAGERPATIDIDLDRRRMIFFSGKKWASFVFDARASAWLEGFILNRIKTPS